MGGQIGLAQWLHPGPSASLWQPASQPAILAVACWGWSIKLGAGAGGRRGGKVTRSIDGVASRDKTGDEEEERMNEAYRWDLWWRKKTRGRPSAFK